MKARVASCQPLGPATSKCPPGALNQRGSRQSAGASSSCWWWCAIALFRVGNALALQTAFVPDEYWQALEVAHYAAFGYGHLTWEWKHHLRGFLHPGLFAALFVCLRLLGADTPLAVLWAPRVLQGLLQAAGDWGLYALARAYVGPRVAAWAVGCQLLSWFTFYCGGRTLSNSLETVLVTLALAAWPWEADLPEKEGAKQGPSSGPVQFTARHRHHRQLALAIGVAAFAVRPTSAVVLAFLGLRALWLYPFWERLRFVLAEAVPIGAAGLAISMGVDYLFYGEVTWVPWNFVKFNIAHNVASFYGTHPPHWYLTQGLPTILGSYVPVFVLGAALCRRRALLGIFAWTVAIYSLLAHKEFRFVFPVLPIAHLYVGYGLEWAYRRCVVSSGDSSPIPPAAAAAPLAEEDDNDKGGEGAGTPEVGSTRKRSKRSKRRSELKARPVGTPGAAPWKRSSRHGRTRFLRALFYGGCGVLVVTHVAMAAYFSFWHQRGPLDVMHHLRNEAHRLDGKMEVFFLMPCHSTPYYAYLHTPIAMDFVQCLPPITHDRNVSTYVYTDETTLMYRDPERYLKERFEEAADYPSHVVLFEPLLPLVESFLVRHGYRQEARFWHTWLLVDDRQGDVLVYRRRSSPDSYQ